MKYVLTVQYNTIHLNYMIFDLQRFLLTLMLWIESATLFVIMLLEYMAAVLEYLNL